MSNLVDFVLPVGEGILPSSMRLGQSITVGVSEGIERISIETTGAAELPGAASGAIEVGVVDGRVTIPGADLVGLREVRVVSEDAALDGTLLGSTAVNLFSADESDVAPGDPVRITDMGRVPDDEGPSEQSARSEWWWPIALVALALLSAEWLLFHRPTRRTLARAFGRRPQPLGGRAR
jgi:hypothetical protein